MDWQDKLIHLYVYICQCELRVESIAYLSFLEGSIISPLKEGARDGLAR